jgi:uncharacterized SAM-binding protein YcdF (DUF218 family)
MDHLGNLNAESRARVDRAARVIHEGDAPLLVTCGWAYRGDSDICIADAMKDYAERTLHIDPSAIVAERAPRDTVGDAVFTKRNLAAPRCWSQVLVVTSDYHLQRACTVFSFVYGPTIQVTGLGAPGEATLHRESSEAQSLAAFRNTFHSIAAGDDAAIFERLLTKHPFYNGEIFPLPAAQAVPD